MFKKIFLINLINLFLIQFSYSNIDIKARTVILQDFLSGEILYEKEPDRSIYPASMTKIMTSIVAFDLIESGDLKLDEKFIISEKAWRLSEPGSSSMFVMVGDEVSVENLLKGIIIASGNDACVTLAEGIAGSEEEFAVMMTSKAKEIGMNNTNFTNSSGWPNDNHYTTAKDLAKVAEFTLNEHPELYKMYAITEFTYSGIKQDNRNPLLYSFEGADGFKTGHTQAAGYGLVGSAERGGRRLLLVLNGLESSRSRAQESLRLMDWGFNNFQLVDFYKQGEFVIEASTWLGKQEKVKLSSQQDISVSIPKTHISDMKVEVLVEEPIPTPITINDQIGLVQISYADKKLQYPLLASENIEQKGFFSRITSALYYLVLGSN